MKKKAIMTMAAVAVALVSCEEAEINGNDNSGSGKSVSFTGTIVTPTTRTVFYDGGYKVFWYKGDKVYINNEEFEADFDGLSEDSCALIGFYRATSELKANDQFKAIYPSSLRKDNGSFELPERQEYTGRYINNLPMYAHSNANPDLHFKNICGVLGITVKESDMDYVKVIRVSNSSHDMHGTFTVNENEAAEISSDNGEKAYVWLDCIVNRSPTPIYGKRTFYIALPIPELDRDYNDLQVDITGVKDQIDVNRTMKARKQQINIDANTIYNWDFLPEGTYPLTSTPIVSSTVTDGFSQSIDTYGNKILILTVPANDSPTYATIYCADYNLMVPSTVKVYGFTEKNGTLVKGEAITSTIFPSNYAILPAGKGFLVEVQSSSISQIVTFYCTEGNATVANEASNLVGFGAVGTPGNFTKDNSKNYYVWCQPDGYNYGWYLYSGETIPDFTAYYAVSKTN